MNERERLGKRIAATDFAMWELHLYMNSHPNDESMAKKFDEYKQKSMELRKNYEEKYGPIRLNNMESNRWAWISNPWPWENEEEVI